MSKIKCVVVTPERTEIDREVDSIVLPMFDGELGVLPKRAAMIGRLGYGTITLTSGAEVEKLFIDGGFAQVEDNVISLLTSRAIPIDQIDVAAAEKVLESEGDLPSGTEEQRQLREVTLMRARGQIRAVRS